MRRPRQDGKTVGGSQARRPVWALLPCAVGVALVGLSGCQAPNETRAKTADPLTGEQGPQKIAVGQTLPPQNRAGMTPAQPSTIASKSTAALLDPDPLQGGKPPLVIPDPQKQQVAVQPTGDWQAKPGGSPTGGQSALPVTLKLPVATQPSVPPPVPGANGSIQPLPNAGCDPAQLAALKQRGVLWQNQQQVDGGMHFSCAVPNPKDASFSRVYEATAADLRSAVNAVLEQIDQNR
jgi:hypothetical protein